MKLGKGKNEGEKQIGEDFPWFACASADAYEQRCSLSNSHFSY